jgi:hypothetical protein
VKIYLAIPYTGMEALSFETANRIAGRLMQEGHIVFSPISHSHPIAKTCELPKHWDYWKQADTSFLAWCDVIRVVTLPGWQTSKGVTAELDIGSRLGKGIGFIDPADYSVSDTK